MDGNLGDAIDGEVNWAQKSYAIGTGDHVLRWRYVKDSSDSAGADAGWVDGIQLKMSEPLWTSRYPEMRGDAAMAFDSARGRIVMQGGDFSGNFADTWEWDGSRWSLIQTSAPFLRRTAHAMAYDSLHEKIVVFGGYGTQTLGDTLEYDGEVWRQRPIPGPPARNNSAMVYDSYRSKVVLFGGNLGNGTISCYADTWEYDGLQWSQKFIAGPSARGKHAMAYDSSRHVTVLFGGALGGTRYGDTWEYNGSTWTMVTNTGPPAREDHVMAYDVQRGQVVLHGGRNSTSSFRDIWEWDGAKWRERTFGFSPWNNLQSAMAYDTVRGEMLLWIKEGRTYTYNGTNWRDRTWYWPTAENGAGMAFDSSRGKVVLFGGQTNPGEILDETREWAGGWTKRSLAGPPARWNHSMAYDSLRRRTIVFGGNSSTVGVYPSTRFGDTWEFDGVSWTKPAETGPVARDEAAMAFDPRRGKTVLYGGNTHEVSLDDTWEWDGTTWEQIAVSGPGRLWGHAMTYDTTSGTVVLYGGHSPVAGDSDETWAYDGSQWTRIATSGPGGRVRHAMAYDPGTKQIVLFGGAGNGSLKLGDMWTFDGGSWKEVYPPIVSPNARTRHRMVFNSLRWKIFLYGGEYMAPGGYGWEFRDPAAQIPPSALGVH